MVSIDQESRPQLAKSSDLGSEDIQSRCLRGFHLRRAQREVPHPASFAWFSAEFSSLKAFALQCSWCFHCPHLKDPHNSLTCAPSPRKTAHSVAACFARVKKVRVKEFPKLPASQPKLGNGILSPSSGVTNSESSLGPTLKKVKLHKDMNTKGQDCWDSLQKLLSITSTQSFTKGS